jgi:homoserine kinase
MKSLKEVSARAYATVANLGYGFDVFGMAVTAGFDEVHLERRGRGITIRVEGDHAGSVPTDPDHNTAGVALAKMLEHHGIREGVRITLRKGIRHGSGLGSSAAGSAAAVMAANRLFGLHLPLHHLVPYAAHGETASAGTAHPDNVTPALFGGFTINDRKNFTQVVHIKPRGKIQLVIVTPDHILKTEDSRKVIPKKVTVSEYSQGCARSGAIVAALVSGDALALGRAFEGSFAERARSSLIPGYDTVREEAVRAGATGVTISGSGPSLVAIAGKRVNARTVARAMEEGFRSAGLLSRSVLAGIAGGARILRIR